MAIWLLELEPRVPPKTQHLPKREHTAIYGSYNPVYGLEQCRKQAPLQEINFVRQNLYFWRQTTLQSIIVFASYYDDRDPLGDLLCQRPAARRPGARRPDEGARTVRADFASPGERIPLCRLFGLIERQACYRPTPNKARNCAIM
jgi:hypothetical protein